MKKKTERTITYISEAINKKSRNLESLQTREEIESLLKNMRDEINRKFNPKSNSKIIKELQAKIHQLEKNQQENLILQQTKIEFNNKLSELRAEMMLSQDFSQTTFQPTGRTIERTGGRSF